MYSGVLLEFLNMGGGEIALIMVVVLLLFGGKKLPELARGLGKGIREFKDASEGVKREIHRNINAVDIEEEIKEQEKEVEVPIDAPVPVEGTAPIQSTTTTAEEKVTEEEVVDTKSKETHS